MSKFMYQLIDGDFIGKSTHMEDMELFSDCNSENSDSIVFEDDSENDNISVSSEEED